jgi:hypothetical protein
VNAEEINGVDVAEFVRGYLTTALWSSTDERDDSGGHPLDDTFSIDDIGDDSRDKAEEDCRAFLERVGQLIVESNYIGKGVDSTLEARAGHDFWLTRHHHGAGFWDGDWLGDVGERLTAESHKFRELNPYVVGEFDAESDCWPDDSSVEFE